MAEEELQGIIEALEELAGDSTVPRNVKTKIAETKDALNSDGELEIRISKALDILEEIADDTNLQPYTRTQLWNIVSLLESI